MPINMYVFTFIYGWDWELTLSVERMKLSWKMTGQSSLVTYKKHNHISVFTFAVVFFFLHQSPPYFKFSNQKKKKDISNQYPYVKKDYKIRTSIYFGKTRGKKKIIENKNIISVDVPQYYRVLGAKNGNLWAEKEL